MPVKGRSGPPRAGHRKELVERGPGGLGGGVGRVPELVEGRPGARAGRAV